MAGAGINAESAENIQGDRQSVMAAYWSRFRLIKKGGKRHEMP